MNSSLLTRLSVSLAFFGVTAAHGAPANLRFQAACEPGAHITIAAMGDVLLHQPLQVQGFNEKDGHISLWRNVLPLIEGADIAYANMEGPVAGPLNSSGKLIPDPGKKFDGSAYTGYPLFNYSPLILRDLRDSGFDVLSTANNHALDRRALGSDRTIENLKKVGMPFTGTRQSGDKDSPWYALIDQGGFRLAFLACAFDTNGIPDPNHQVLHCYKDTALILSTVKELAHQAGIDGVIVTPHWGTEYENAPESKQKTLAHQLIEAGATAVLGSHPHVLQPWEKFNSADGREGFIIYSLGNFVSNQRELPRRSSLILMLGLTRSQSTGKAVVNGVRFVPLAMDFDSRPFRLHVASPSEYSDSWKHVTSLFPAANVFDSKSPFVTNPECH